MKPATVVFLRSWSETDPDEMPAVASGTLAVATVILSRFRITVRLLIDYVKISFDLCLQLTQTSLMLLLSFVQC